MCAQTHTHTYTLSIPFSLTQIQYVVICGNYTVFYFLYALYLRSIVPAQIKYKIPHHKNIKHNIPPSITNVCHFNDEHLGNFSSCYLDLTRFIQCVK